MSGIVVYPTWALPHQPVPTSSAMRNADAYFGERHIYKGRVARKIHIYGVEYPTIREACRATKLSPNTIYYRMIGKSA